MFIITRTAGKFLLLLAHLVSASLIVFFVVDVLPGDPAVVMLRLGATAETLAALRQQLGIDLPWWQRYLHWVVDLFTNAGGVSMAYGVPVATLLADAFAVTGPLAAFAAVLSTATAILLGITAAYCMGNRMDWLIRTCVQIMLAIPNFWFGIFLVLVFAITLDWAPAGGFSGWQQGFLPAIGSLTLPALTLALPQMAILTRLTRASALDTLNDDYMRTARAKGRSRWQALWRHGLPNALIPIFTILALQLSFLIAGAIIVETVFHLPGMGRLLYQAVGNRDLILVKTLVMGFVLMVLCINTLADLAISWIDPRGRIAVKR